MVSWIFLGEGSTLNNIILYYLQYGHFDISGSIINCHPLVGAMLYMFGRMTLNLLAISLPGHSVPKFVARVK